MRIYRIAILVGILTLGCQDHKKKDTQNSTDSNIANQDTTIKPENNSNTAPIITPKGTQLFSKSVKIRDTRWQSGYLLTDILFTECNSEQGEPDWRLNHKINRQVKTDSTFTIYFSIVENCCSDFLCEAEIVDENTLNLIYHSYGSHCSCNCCFGLQYNFEIITNTDQPNIDPNKILYVMINGDKKTKTKIQNSL